MDPRYIGTGIPWYRREDYPRVLKIMADGQDLPRTYDEWQERAEYAERMVREQGGIPVRVPLDPDKFCAWCVMRAMHVDGSARQEFAVDPANWPKQG